VTKGGITGEGVNVPEAWLPGVFDEVLSATKEKRRVVAERVVTGAIPQKIRAPPLFDSTRGHRRDYYSCLLISLLRGNRDGCVLAGGEGKQESRGNGQ
jgi:hypothetical protein